MSLNEFFDDEAASLYRDERAAIDLVTVRMHQNLPEASIKIGKHRLVD